MRYVAAFRLYSWNDTIADLARRFFASFPSARHVVLADLTHGDLGLPPDYEVLWHSDDASELGVASVPPGKTHWYNVDYALYILRRSFPEHEAFVTCESDLAVNLPLETALLQCFDEGVDAVVHEPKASTPDWHWHANGAAVFAAPRRALCFFMMMSAQAVDVLWAARRTHTAALEANALPVWPFCETFIPSVLAQAGLRVAAIGDFAETAHLRFRPRLAADDPRANAAGSLAHSVLQRSDFYRSAVNESPPGDWFRADSELRMTLTGQPLGDFVGLLATSFQSARDHAGYQALRIEAAAAGCPMPESEDLAFCKPALTSSTSPWSRHPEPWRDAAGANGIDEADDHGFHTAREMMPWWMTDLAGEHVVDEVRITNRATFAERFCCFQIQSSRDGSLWTPRYSKLDLQPVSGDATTPFVVVLGDPFIARFIRIVLLGEDTMHLRRVRIFGRPLPQSRGLASQ